MQICCREKKLRNGNAGGMDAGIDDDAWKCSTMNVTCTDCLGGKLRLID